MSGTRESVALAILLALPCCALAPPVIVEGSSSLQPLVNALAVAYSGSAPETPIALSVTGTAQGMAQLCRGAADIAAASRAASSVEREACAARGQSLYFVPLVKDGIVLAVHPDNAEVTSLTTEEVKRLWRSGAPQPAPRLGAPQVLGPQARRWRDLRPSFPDQEVHFYGSTPPSGTHRVFAAALMGGAALRGDVVMSENDHVLARGVSSDRFALGMFGSVYAQRALGLRAVAIDFGSGPVTPSPKTVADGSYAPLTRTLGLYVTARALESETSARFLRFALAYADAQAGALGYAPVAAAERQAALDLVTRGPQ